MEKAARIRHILDTRLTTETLDQVYPPTKALEEVLLSQEELLTRHKTVFIDLLELVGSMIELETGESLQGDTLAIVMLRVKNFLIHRGFQLK
jgi:hypothetical protein